MNTTRYALFSIALVPLSACTSEPPLVEGSVQQLRVQHQDDGHTFVALDFLATAGLDSLNCADGDLEVQLSGTMNGVSIDTPNALTVECVESRPTDVALVVDNSRSVRSVLGLAQEGAHTLANDVFASGGRASLVRVSTTAAVRSELTSDAAAFSAQVDDLHVSNGWTALWDGVRMAHETLGAAHAEPPAPLTDAAAFCAGAEKLAVVAFTDGRENNSAGQKLLSNRDDGMDTVMDDLMGLRADGATTPMYTVALGGEPDHDALGHLAAQSGGRHIAVADADDLPRVFEAVSNYADSTHQVCADIHNAGCGNLELFVKWAYTADSGDRVKGKYTYNMYIPCGDGGPDVDPEPKPEEPIPGESATILLTMSHPQMDTGFASQLAGQAVDYVSRHVDPHVLVVLDDGHHNEFRGDAEFVAGLLEDRGYAVDLIDEPRSGLTEADVDGYDVVWFTNPGWPVDDEQSVRVLDAFRLNGGGVVFQGDDIAWALGRSFSMSDNTGLEFLNNGTSFCGRSTNNNRGNNYTVTVEDNDHPMTAGLAGQQFPYGDDIDNTRRLVGTRVLAWADAEWGDCERIPVITVFD